MFFERSTHHEIVLEMSCFVYINLSSQFYSDQLEIWSTNENIRKRNSLISLVNFYSVFFASTILLQNNLAKKLLKKPLAVCSSKFRDFWTLAPLKRGWWNLIKRARLAECKQTFKNQKSESLVKTKIKRNYIPLWIWRSLAHAVEEGTKKVTKWRRRRRNIRKRKLSEVVRSCYRHRRRRGWGWCSRSLPGYFFPLALSETLFREPRTKAQID